jgi:hypothetical protein
MNAFRGAAATASLAGLSEQNMQWISWTIQGVTADFDGQAGMIPRERHECDQRG